MRAEERSQKNKGFTLVEMIVTVAITAIFSAVVMTAVGAGSRLYRNVSGNTRAQIDAQQLADDMENLIVNTNQTIYYAYGSGNAPGASISNDINSGSSGDKTLLLCTKEGYGTAPSIVNILDWSESEQILYYSQKQIGGSSGEQTLAERSVYAEGVKSFQADVSEAADGGLMRFQLIVEDQGKEIRTLHTVNLRNPVKIALPGTIQQDEGGQPET